MISKRKEIKVENDSVTIVFPDNNKPLLNFIENNHPVKLLNRQFILEQSQTLIKHKAWQFKKDSKGTLQKFLKKLKNNWDFKIKN